MASSAPLIGSAGEGALLIRFGTGIDLEVSEAVLGCLSRLDRDESSSRPDGITDIVPAYAALLVHFDPLRVHRNAVMEWVRSHLSTSESKTAKQPRQIEIPVQYGGKHGLDIDEVAQLTSLGSAAEVARIHSEGEYRVYFLGFLGGFPYLGGLQAPLTSVPRLATPREKLLPGTVGIAGGQTGVYTVESPGGWHLLGKTTMTLFDPSQDPPAVLRAGDLVKFVPVAEEEEDSSMAERKRKAEEAAEAERAAKRRVGAAEGVGSGTVFEILVPGPQTTVQDLCRAGYFRHGVGRAGAADDLALRMGNSLVGNPETEAGLEVLMGGLKLRFSSSSETHVTVAITGADCAVKLGTKARGQEQTVPVRVNQTVALRNGDELTFGYAKDGMRTYVAVAGGIDVPLVLGSKATDVRGRMGGFEGRALQAGDRVPLGSAAAAVVSALVPRLARSTVHDPLRKVVKTGKGGESVWQLRILPGPGDPSVLTAQPKQDNPLCLNGRTFSVLAKSDRMAACLSLSSSDSADFERTSPLKGAQQLSEPCVSGTVQLPPDGNPVILLAEHQTTGGYKVAGTVIKADLWCLGQMRPKDQVQFVEVEEDAAVSALKQARERWAKETRPLAMPLDATRTSIPEQLQTALSDVQLVPRASASALKRIDLNADAGEGFDDETLLKYVTSVNIACGGHVGDEASMARTVELAVKAGAGIGAHVSFVDREGFGRKRLDTPPKELFHQVLSQAGALMAVASAAGRKVRYMKPHGALYHTVMEGGEQGTAVWEAAQLLGLPMMLMPRSGWATFGEGFSERAYDSNGKEGPGKDEWYNLRPRDKPGAVIHDPAEAAQQALRLAKQPKIHSICVHSDSPNAANVAKAVREALEKEYEMRPFCTPESDFQPTSVANSINDAPRPGVQNPPSTTAAGGASASGTGAPSGPVGSKAEFPMGLKHVLEKQIAPMLLKGYRTGEGCEPDLYPQPRACEAVEKLMVQLNSRQAEETMYSKFAQGLATYEEYIADLRKQLAKQGGGWMTVAPRDTCQQGSDSESAAISDLSRKNAQLFAAKAGCVGYEIGGAQYQAALIRGFDPAAVLRLGLPTNLPAHSLQRAQYVNGLAELAPPVRQALFQATAEMVSGHYRGAAKGVDPTVPWHPYNFHAGNFFDDSTGYSPLDETTGELLDAGCCPMPCWVFSGKFSLQQLEKWTERQIALWSKRKRTLHCIRIKNPGQGKDWTAAAVWQHCKVIIRVFKASSPTPEPPIIYIHNHDMNGAGGHIGAELLQTAQAAGFSTLVIDAAFRKNGTHNDNTIVAAVLTLDDEQRTALAEYNRNQQVIEKLLCRFDSRTSQMTPWDSDWAGGTEGSDLRIAKEFNLDPQQIETAKRVASAVFPLERAVTPFSEYKLRLGIGIMIEPGIKPKTAEAVRDWVMKKNGKLKVGGDVLLGLKRWETLVAKPVEVDTLLANMAAELSAALAAQTDATKRVVPTDVPAARFTAAQRVTALGFQQKGLEFIHSTSKTAKDLSPLLTAPHVLHRKPLALPAGTTFEILTDPKEVAARALVKFAGYDAQGEEVVLSFEHEPAGDGKALRLDVAIADPDAARALRGFASAGASATLSYSTSGVRKADPTRFPREFPCEVPGEVLVFAVKVGDVLVHGQALCTVECMKMEMVIAVPADLAGKRVKALGAKARTSTAKGDCLSPGDLLLEVE